MITFEFYFSIQCFLLELIVKALTFLQVNRRINLNSAQPTCKNIRSNQNLLYDHKQKMAIVYEDVNVIQLCLI